MRRPEYLVRWRALGCVVVSLYLALSVTDADALASMVQDARPMVASDMTSSPAEAMDCIPCARCYAAPAPLTQLFVGQGNGSDPTAWRNDAAQRSAADRFDTGDRRAPLSLRIAYCRWRN